MSTPEWSIFDRLEELEDITLKLMEKTETAEPTLKSVSTVAKDASILARYAILFAFTSSVADKSDDPRRLKDTYIEFLKRAGLSEEQLKRLRDRLVTVCEIIKEMGE